MRAALVALGLFVVIPYQVIGPSLSGQILTNERLPDPVLKRIRVWLLDLNDPTTATKVRVGMLADTEIPAASVDMEGRFRIPSVPPGKYSLTVAYLPVAWRLSAAIVDGKDILDTHLTVAESDLRLPSMILSITNRPSVVKGSVELGSRDVATILAFPKDPALRTAARRVRSVVTRANGSFAFESLPAGDYLFTALTRRPSQKELADLDWLERLAPSASLLSVTEGEQSLQALRLID